LSSSKYLYIFYLFTILLFVNSCSRDIYKSFEEPILTENILEINDSIIKKDPIKLLIQPNSPINTTFNYPLGLSIYKLASDDPDEKFETWLYKNPNRYKRLSKILSEKQITQLKRYNNSFNDFLKNLGQEPIKIKDLDVNQNILRLKQYYKNEGFFDSNVYVDTIINENQAKIKYNVTTNTRYLIDSISIDVKSKDIDSLIRANKKLSFLKQDENFSITKLILERDRLVKLFKNNGIYDFQQRSISYNVLIDSSGINKRIPLIISIKNPKVDSIYEIKKINDINIYVETLDELSNINSFTDSINYKGIKIFSKGNLNYSPKSLTEPIFYKKGENYSDEKKLLTSRYFSNLGAFKYPRIITEEFNDSLSSSIYLLPRNRFSLGFDLDFTHSNIEDFGISFGTNFNIRNIFRATENLSLNLNNSIGASKDIGDPNDSFFNLFELGGNLNLRIPRAILPFKSERIIRKEMNPVTNILVGSTVQKNIGLDKQYYSGIYEVNWNPFNIL
jgi:hypothetical protein